ncbi:hypothetical protein QFZ84_001680 [Pseudomonas fluorescens]
MYLEGMGDIWGAIILMALSIAYYQLSRCLWMTVTFSETSYIFHFLFLSCWRQRQDMNSSVMINRDD